MAKRGFPTLCAWGWTQPSIPFSLSDQRSQSFTDRPAYGGSLRRRLLSGGGWEKESYGKLTDQLACRTNPLGVCTCVSPLGAARGIHLGSPSVPSHKHGLAVLRPVPPGPPRTAPGTPQQGLAKPRGCGTRPLALGQGVQPGLLRRTERMALGHHPLLPGPPRTAPGTPQQDSPC